MEKYKRALATAHRESLHRLAWFSPIHGLCEEEEIVFFPKSFSETLAFRSEVVPAVMEPLQASVEQCWAVCSRGSFLRACLAGADAIVAPFVPRLPQVMPYWPY